MSEFDAWEPEEEPPAGFADRVVREGMAGERAQPAGAPSRSTRTFARALGAGVLVVAAAAAAVLVVWPAQHAAIAGDQRASDRMQLEVGPRAVLVLEPGAHVTWKGDDVTQDEGDVFYRVDRGGRFVVHTPSGDVEVQGTAFRVKVRTGTEDRMQAGRRDVASGAIGAALTALAFVGVYEGKVRVSHAQESATLTAGESAQAGPGGVRRTGGVADGEKEFERGESDPTVAANRNLAESVKDYKERLDRIESQKKTLEKDLASAQEKLAIAANDGAALPIKDSFDLGPEDWADLAKDGTIKFRVPCSHPKEWKPKPESLDKLGLAPGDTATLRDAYAKSNQRVWAQMKPLCAQAAGTLEVAEKLGASTCTHLIVDVARAEDPTATNEAMRVVGEIRAGLRPVPGPDEKMHPVEKLFLILTAENKAFEGDLAQSVGPADAHRIAFADGLCSQTSVFGGSGPREPREKK
jgi:ferric-dicitrate binding protein FerR (iron transport regulator)